MVNQVGFMVNKVVFFALNSGLMMAQSWIIMVNWMRKWSLFFNQWEYDSLGYLTNNMEISGYSHEIDHFRCHQKKNVKPMGNP